MNACRLRHPLLPIALALCIAVGLQAAVLRSQPPSPPRVQTVVVNGHEAVAGEVLVQFESVLAAAANEGALGDRVDAERRVPVGRGALRRFRSRTFDVDTLIAYFRAQPDVVFAEPNYVLRAHVIPNDPEFGTLWGLLNVGQRIGRSTGTAGADISATNAWEVSTGSNSSVVGIIDSGIDYTHPDLADNVWSAPTAFRVQIGGVSIDCPAGSHGFNAITRDCDPWDDWSHGTHVAGTIGARGNNGVGVAGVNWTTSIMAARFLDATGVGTTADAIDSIEFMIQAKAAFAASNAANIRVLNNSWGGGAFSVALQNAISAADASQMLFVAAAGNNARDIDPVPHYPASYDLPNIVAVAATTNQDLLWSASNYGAASVALAAPGEFILSTVPNAGYGFRSGTSMAAPHVAGGAALLLSVCSFDTATLKNALLSTVDGVPALAARVATGGRLNLDRAIRTCAEPSIPAAPTALTATGGVAQVALTWGPASGATSYKVKRSTAPGGPYEVLAAGVTSTAYTDRAVTPGQPYFYVVSAVNAIGESADSGESSATPLEAGDPVPGAPGKLEAVPGNATVTLTWTESTGATRYRVKRSLTKSGPYERVGRTRKTSFVDDLVVNGTKYFYIVTAVNDSGESPSSNKASATPAPVPAAPQVTAVQGANAGEIQLTWAAVEWATKYRVRRSGTIGGPYSGVGRFTTLAVTDSGLKSGKRYFYVVTALNDSGESPGTEVSAIAK